MKPRMEIEELKSVQRERKLLDVHLVSLDDKGFTIAHTDGERHEAAYGGPSLEECELHQAILELADGLGTAGLPEESGEYMVTRHQPDGYSESYRSGAVGWDFEPLPEP